jgi:arylsulfatase A-like enzyme
MYGPDVEKPGTFANCALMARRLAERGVRFVQIFHRGWDQHGDLVNELPRQTKDVDQACYALITDLKQRGLLDDTLVIWGGEFGRTIYCQGGLTKDNYGRDHHPRCFPTWMAGGGIKPGIVHGETDDFSYNITKDPVHIHDLNATILHCLGIDHMRLTVKFQGLDQRLTGVEHPRPVQAILA